MTAHLDHGGVLVPRFHVQHRVDHGESRDAITAPGEKLAQLNAELYVAGPKPVALGRGPVRFGGLAQEIAAVEVQGVA